MMTEEQVLEAITTIKMLDPTSGNTLSDEQFAAYLNIAYVVVSKNENLSEDKFVLALALKTLSFIFLPENSSLSSKKIKDVSITYYQGQGKSKWDSLYDALLAEDKIPDNLLEYVGI